MEKKPADVRWLLTLLAIFVPDDEVFKKSYRYVPPPKPVPVEPMLDNSDGFWDDLPPLSQ